MTQSQIEGDDDEWANSDTTVACVFVHMVKGDGAESQEPRKLYCAERSIADEVARKYNTLHPEPDVLTVECNKATAEYRTVASHGKPSQVIQVIDIFDEI